MGVLSSNPGLNGEVGGGGLLPNMGSIGMLGPKGLDCRAVLVSKRV